MTRKKEILKAAQEYAKHKDIDLCLIPLAEQNAFYSGAEWADKTMIEKAAEWLSELDDAHFIEYNNDGYPHIDIYGLVRDFKKYMEDKQ